MTRLASESAEASTRTVTCIPPYCDQLDVQMERTSVSSLEDPNWPYSFSRHDPRLEAGVSRVGWINNMDRSDTYMTDTGGGVFYYKEDVPGWNQLVDAKRAEGDPVLLQLYPYYHVQKICGVKAEAFSWPPLEFPSNHEVQTILSEIIKRYGSGKVSGKTRNDIAALILTTGDVRSIPGNSRLIMLCTNYESLKFVHKNHQRYADVNKMVELFSEIPYTIRVMTKSGLHVDCPKILQALDLPDNLDEFIELSIRLKPAWCIHPDDRINENSLAVLRLPNKPMKSITINPSNPRLDPHQSSLGRVRAMGHDQMFFIDSNLFRRYKDDEIPGFKDWVRENKKRGCGVHIHAFTAQKVAENGWGPIPDVFRVIPYDSYYSPEKLKDFISEVFANLDVDFSRLSDTKQETMILSLQTGRISRSYCYHEDNINAVLLTEDFDGAQFIYADYQRFSNLYYAGMEGISDFRLILPEGYYADFETHNQTFKMEEDRESFIRQCQASKPRFGFLEEKEEKLKLVQELIHEVGIRLGIR